MTTYFIFVTWFKKVDNANNKKYYKTNYKGFSLVDALKRVGIDSSFNNRKKLASLNGISNYKGYAWQNTKLLNLLKQGNLIGN